MRGSELAACLGDPLDRAMPPYRRMTAVMRSGKVAACLAFVWVAAVAVVSAQPGRNRSVPGQLLVTFGPAADAIARGAAHRAAGSRAVADIAGTRVAVVSVAPGDEAAAIARYRNNRNVRSVEPTYIRRVPEPTAHDGGAVVPRDAYFGQQWGFHSTGQEFYCFDWIFGPLCFYQGVADADIDAPEAWAVLRCRRFWSSSPAIRWCASRPIGAALRWLRLRWLPSRPAGSFFPRKP